MKTFKFYLAALAMALCAGFTSCSSEYDDSEIWNKVNELMNRVQKLEASVQQQNANITALQTMLDAIKNNVYVTSVEELTDGKGYALKFSNGKEVKIYHGKKGDQGESPSITIINEGDNYYWCVNGEILKDDEGNNIPADGGAADVLPQLKTGSQLEAEGVAGTWEKDAVYVTTDHVTWKKVNVGDSTGTSIFTSVEISEDGTTIIITLSDGSTISMPKSSKIQEMLYGGWISGTEMNDERYILIFNEDGTFNDIFNWKIDRDNADVECGALKFLPDNYICTSSFDFYYGEGYSAIAKIVEISDKQVFFSGDFAEGVYTRMTKSEMDYYYTLVFVNDAEENWSDGVNDYLLNADGTGKFNSESISWKVENSKLLISNSAGEIILNRTYRFIDNNAVILSDENGSQLKWFVKDTYLYDSGSYVKGTWTCNVFGDNAEVIDTYTIDLDYYGNASIEMDGVLAYTNYRLSVVANNYEVTINWIDQIEGPNLSGRQLLLHSDYPGTTSQYSGTLYYWNFDAYGWHISKKYNVTFTR